MNVPENEIIAFLLDNEAFQCFCRTVSRLTGLAIMLLSPSGQCYSIRGVPSSRNSICDKIGLLAKGNLRCVNCDLSHSRKAIAKGRPLFYTCHAGFLDVVVPIYRNGTYIASFSTGQVLPEPPSEEGFRSFCKRLAWLGLDPVPFRRNYFNAPYQPREKIRLVMTLLQLFADHLLETLQTIHSLQTRLERDDVSRAKEFIAKHALDPNLSLASVAEAAGAAPTHFSRVFKKSMKMPFTHYVQEARIAHAKSLLLDTNMTVTAVCFSSGFNNLAHFSRIFEAHMGLPPKEWRKKNRKG